MGKNFTRIRLKCETLLAERVDSLIKQNEGRSIVKDESRIEP